MKALPLKQRIDSLLPGQDRARLAQMYSLLELAVSAFAAGLRKDAADNAAYLANVAEAFAKSMRDQEVGK